MNLAFYAERGPEMKTSSVNTEQMKCDTAARLVGGCRIPWSCRRFMLKAWRNSKPGQIAQGPPVHTLHTSHGPWS